MNNDLETFIGAMILIAILVGVAIGAVKTFRRNWVAALLLLIFLPPIWMIWAIIECFRGPVVESEVQFGSRGQNVNVTVVNQAGDPMGSYANVVSNADPKRIGTVRVRGSGRAEPQLIGSDVSKFPVPEMKACPHCAEDLKVGAKICRYCNRDV